MGTYTEMVLQIEELKRQAEKVRREEKSSVLRAMKTQISDYGITAEELGFGKDKSRLDGRGKKLDSRKRRAGGAKPKRGNSPTRKAVAPKYRDDAGNTWTGRGKQPRWIVTALANGRTLDSLLIS